MNSPFSRSRLIFDEPSSDFFKNVKNRFSWKSKRTNKLLQRDWNLRGLTLLSSAFSLSFSLFSLSLSLSPPRTFVHSIILLFRYCNCTFVHLSNCLSVCEQIIMGVIDDYLRTYLHLSTPYITLCSLPLDIPLFHFCSFWHYKIINKFCVRMCVYLVPNHNWGSKYSHLFIVD